MSWAWYTVLFVSLAVNGVCLMTTLPEVFMDDEDLDLWPFVGTAVLTPLNLIWLASL